MYVCMRVCVCLRVGMCLYVCVFTMQVYNKTTTLGSQDQKDIIEVLICRLVTVLLHR